MLGIGRSQLRNDAVLGKVGVLILVDEDITEAGSVFLADVFVVAEQEVGVKQQVVEVHGIGHFATLHIVLVNLARFPHVVVKIPFIDGSVGGILFGQNQSVLGLRYLVENTGGLVGLFVQPHLLHNGFDQTAGIGRIVYGIVAAEPDKTTLGTKNAPENRMERARP